MTQSVDQNERLLDWLVEQVLLASDEEVASFGSNASGNLKDYKRRTFGKAKLLVASQKQKQFEADNDGESSKSVVNFAAIRETVKNNLLNDDSIAGSLTLAARNSKKLKGDSLEEIVDDLTYLISISDDTSDD